MDLIWFFFFRYMSVFVWTGMILWWYSSVFSTAVRWRSERRKDRVHWGEVSLVQRERVASPDNHLLSFIVVLYVLLGTVTNSWSEKERGIISSERINGSQTWQHQSPICGEIINSTVFRAVQELSTAAARIAAIVEEGCCWLRKECLD